MSNPPSYLNALPLRRKILLSLGLLCLLSFFIGITYSSTRTPEPKIVEPDYNSLFHSAMGNFEEAENALIYKDAEKCKKLLQTARKAARLSLPSTELRPEAENLLMLIEKKEAEADKLLAEKK